MRPLLFLTLIGVLLVCSAAVADDDVKLAAILARQLDRVPEATVDSSGLTLDTYIRAYTMLQKASKSLGTQKEMDELSRVVLTVHSNILKKGGVRIPVITIIEDGIKMALICTTYNDKPNRPDMGLLYGSYSFLIIQNPKRHELHPVDLAAYHEADVSDIMRTYSQMQGITVFEFLKKLELSAKGNK